MNKLQYLWLDRKYLLNKQIERLLINFVWCLPGKIVYWSAIRVIANATTGKYENQIVPELLAMDALKRWDDGRI